MDMSPTLLSEVGSEVHANLVSFYRVKRSDLKLDSQVASIRQFQSVRLRICLQVKVAIDSLKKILDAWQWLPRA